MAPLLISRLNTVAQVLFAGLVLAIAGMAVADRGIGDMMGVVVAATTTVSGAAYMIAWVRRLAGPESPESEAP
jgi:cardiolipin synthase